MTGKLGISTASKAPPLSVIPVSPSSPLPRQERHASHLHQAENATKFAHVCKQPGDQGNGSKPLSLNSVLSREEETHNYVCSSYKLL